MKKMDDGTVRFHGVRDIPPAPVSVATTEFNRTGTWKTIEPYYQEFTAPCLSACPAGKDIPREMNLLAEGKLDAALAVCREANPFPAICGRVCPHPCETSCNRNISGGAVAIHALERFIGDFALDHGKPLKPLGKCPERVAIVGAGPAGLSCAFYLGRTGYSVTVFESRPQIGGLLRYGIPSFRLPKEIVDRELNIFGHLPVHFECGRTLGKNLSIHDLKMYDAIFLALGRYKSRLLGIEPQNDFSLYSGIELLELVQRGSAPSMGDRVIVVGGGSTAFDCARTLKRMKKHPTLVYRRTLQEMPAFRHDIEGAQEEGIPIMFLAAPTQIVCEGSHIKEVVFSRMTPGPPDASGRRSVAPAPGKSFKMPADAVIRAVGEDPDVDYLSDVLVVNERGIKIDSKYRTSVEGIFAGGDGANGYGTVSHAIGDGRRAAAEIDRTLRGTTEIAVNPVSLRKADPALVAPTEINLSYFSTLRRLDLKQLPAEARSDFSEIERGMDMTSAVREASRCFVCGTCTRCDNCKVFCPDNAIKPVGNGYRIDYRYCKGCGICVQECPRKAIAMREAKPL